MNYKELAQKTKIELQNLLVETKKELQILQFQRATKKLANVRAIRKTRQSIAQILTALNSRSHD